MKTELNQQLIDQLVCGELEGADYRRAILALEADPPKWRDCALAFLQEQAIAQELSQLSKASIDWHASNNVASSQEHPTCLSRTIGADLYASSPSSSNKSADHHLRWASFSKLGSMAAIVLLSFSIGWMSSNMGDRNPTTPELIAGTDTPSQTQHQVPVRERMSMDPVGSQSSLQDTRLVSNKEAGRGNFTKGDWKLLPIDQQIPDNLMRLEKEGRIKIESNTALMPVDYDGVMMLVPVQQIQVVPTTFSY